MRRSYKTEDRLVTIRDLLEDSALKMQAVSVTGASMQAPVSWVHATEQIDPRPHVRLSELVCTLGSALELPGAASIFVSAVADAGAAGICLGMGEVHIDVPQELLEACTEAEIPLLRMPHGVPFLAINDTARRIRARAEKEALKAESTVLSSLLDFARDGADEETLLEKASGTFVGRMLWKDGASRPEDPADLGALGDNGVTWEGEGLGPSESFLSQLASLLHFTARGREREFAERRQQLGQLLELVAKRLAHPAAVLPDLKRIGLEQSRLLISSWPLGSEAIIAKCLPHALVGSTARDVLAISQPDSIDLVSGPGMVFGCSGAVSLDGLSGGVREARAALRLALNRGVIVGPGQLVNLEALLEQQPAEWLAPFVEQLLGPILRADEGSKGQLLSTLAAFISFDRQLQSTADSLYVHVNTVRHRLNRVSELSERDPLTLVGITDLRIALWALERRETIGYRLNRPPH